MRSTIRPSCRALHPGRSPELGAIWVGATGITTRRAEPASRPGLEAQPATECSRRARACREEPIPDLTVVVIARSAVIFDGEFDFLETPSPRPDRAPHGQMEDDPCRLSVLGRIGDRLLRDAVEIRRRRRAGKHSKSPAKRISKRVWPRLRPFHPATRPSRLAANPSSSTSGGRNLNSAPRSVSIMSAPFARCCRIRPEGQGQSCAALWPVDAASARIAARALPELVVKLARQVPAFVVLQARSACASTRCARRALCQGFRRGG